MAANGVAATSHPLASATALTILREGGNAVDAALAAVVTLAVVEPHMTGLGGDSFAIVAEPDGNVHGLNGSGRSGAAADLGWYLDKGFDEVPPLSAHAVTVPGAVKAWETLHGRFGALPFERLFVDAIGYAEEGFAVAPRVAHDWAGEAATLRRDAGARQHFLRAGAAPATGERMRFPAMAETLRTVARGGAGAFYEGPIAAEIAAVVQEQGGFLTEADMAAVTADWVAPAATDYGAHSVLELPPNGVGIVALILFNLLDVLETRTMPPDSALRYHLEIEAARMAYAVRDAMVADPDHMTGDIATLTGRAYAEGLAERIDRRRRNGDLRLPDLPDADTVYLTVADRDGRMVSLISSNYGFFGAQIATPASGIMLQNRGACFRVARGHPNAIGAAKRPLHTIIPAMALSGGMPAVSFGVMGGAFQPMGHAHVFANCVDHGMDPQQAIDHGRIFWEKDGALGVEASVAAGVGEALAAMGHDVRPASQPWGGAQMIAVDRARGCYVAGSDPRKDGQAIGY